MKEDSPTISNGFPLTAVSIGVVLFFLGFVVFSKLANDIPRGNERTGRSQMAATSLANAVEQFHADYNRLPEVPAMVTTDTAGGIRLLNVLCARVPTDDPAGNTRGVRYLSIVERKGGQGGAVYDPDDKTITGLYDWWGTPFTIFLDTDSDEVLEFQLGKKEVKLTGMRSAVVSPGEDGRLGTADDVKTW